MSWTKTFPQQLRGVEPRGVGCFFVRPKFIHLPSLSFAQPLTHIPHRTHALTHTRTHTHSGNNQPPTTHRFTTLSPCSCASLLLLCLLEISFPLSRVPQFRGWDQRAGLAAPRHAADARHANFAAADPSISTANGPRQSSWDTANCEVRTNYQLTHVRLLTVLLLLSPTCEVVLRSNTHVHRAEYRPHLHTLRHRSRPSLSLSNAQTSQKGARDRPGT